MKSVSRLDVFPKFDLKFEQDARQRTVSGGVLSVVTVVFIALLAFSEVKYFFSVTESHEMYVDPSIGGQMMINVNVTFPRVPCDLISLDSVDSFGQYAEGLAANIVKTRVAGETLSSLGAARPVVDLKKKITKALDPNGEEKENCPSCYGAETEFADCCHTCDDVRKAYARKNWRFDLDDISIEQCAEERVKLASQVAGSEGCNVVAKFSVARVTGNIYFIPGRAFSVLGRRMLDYAGATVRHLNLSHIIHTLQFGDRFEGQLNPLDGYKNIRGMYDGNDANGVFEPVAGHFTYFVKVVPTQIQRSSSLIGLGGSVVESNQYSVTQHFSPYPAQETEGQQRFIPGIFITYEMSPIKVAITTSHPYPSFLHFLLQLCAICGGVFTVIGIIDSIFFHGIRRIQRKMEQGKQL